MRRKPAAPKTLAKDDSLPLGQAWQSYVDELSRQEALGAQHPLCRLLMLRFSAEFLRTWAQVKQDLSSPEKHAAAKKSLQDLLQQLSLSLHFMYIVEGHKLLDKQYLNSLVFFAALYAWFWDSHVISRALKLDFAEIISRIADTLRSFKESPRWSSELKALGRQPDLFFDMKTRLYLLFGDGQLTDGNSSLVSVSSDPKQPDATPKITQQRGMELFFLSLFPEFTEGLTPAAIKAAFPAWEEQASQFAEDLEIILKFLNVEHPALAELKNNLAVLCDEVSDKKRKAEEVALSHARQLEAEEAIYQQQQELEQARMAVEEKRRLEQQKERDELQAARRLAKAAARQAEIEDLAKRRQALREEYFLAKLSRHLGGAMPMAAQAEPVAASRTEEFLIGLIKKCLLLPSRIAEIKKYKNQNPNLPLVERIYLCHSLSECLRASLVKDFASVEARKKELAQLNSWVVALQKELKPFLARPDSQVLASWLRHASIVESDAKAPAVPAPLKKPAGPSLFMPASAAEEQQTFYLPDGVAELLAIFPKVKGYLGIGYLVGGVPRDLLAGLQLDEAPDLDIVVTGVLPDEIYRIQLVALVVSAFAQKIIGGVKLRCEDKDVRFEAMPLPGRYNLSVTTDQVTISGRRSKTYNFQVSFTPRSFEEDAFSRDATCNAIALDRFGRVRAPHTESISDAKKKYYRPIDMERFFDDPVRPLRALKAQYIKGFEWQDASFVVKLEGWFNEHFCRALRDDIEQFLDGMSKKGHFVAKLYELLISVPREQEDQQKAILRYFVNPETKRAEVLGLLSDAQRRFLARWPAYSVVIAKMGPSIEYLVATGELELPVPR